MAEAGWRGGVGLPGDQEDAVEWAWKSAAQARSRPNRQAGAAQSWPPPPPPRSTSGFGRTQPGPSVSARQAPAAARPKASPWVLRKRPMSGLEREACHRVIELRRELQISQSQLARLLNVNIRTVKRWERYQCKPQRRQRQWLWRLSDYAKNYGLEAFRVRFLRDEEPRYHQSGPAGRLGTLLFDTELKLRPTGGAAGLG